VAVVIVATCQFPTSGDVPANLGHITKQLRVAKQRGADVAHFPEGALSGYVASDLASFERYDWDALRQAAGHVLELAARLRIWVVVGSAHRLSDGNKPHNSLYVIDDGGRVVDRYDKRFCAGDPDGHTEELAHYSPGDHGSVWEIKGVRCGALICYEYRFPELHREYARDGVELLFHSFNAAHATAERVSAIGAGIGTDLKSLNPAPTFTYPGITMPAAMTAAAASSHLWISCPNSSAPESLWPSFFVRADGITVGRLRRNRAGILISAVDTDEALYTTRSQWRERALAGVLHSGTPVSDPRSTDRWAL
jgi:deaminated glutathione amidase